MIDSISDIDGHKVDPTTVFLISGQELEDKVGGRRGPSSTTTQRVVIAPDASEAMRKLAELEPDFKRLGIASLSDYEAAVKSLRAVVRGTSTEWVLYGI